MGMTITKMAGVRLALAAPRECKRPITPRKLVYVTVLTSILWMPVATMAANKPADLRPIQLVGTGSGNGNGNGNVGNGNGNSGNNNGNGNGNGNGRVGSFNGNGNSGNNNGNGGAGSFSGNGNARTNAGPSRGVTTGSNNAGNLSTNATSGRIANDGGQDYQLRHRPHRPAWAAPGPGIGVPLPQ